MITACNRDLRPFEDCIATFCKEVLKPNTAKHDQYPFGDCNVGVIESTIQQIYELGFLGIMLPEKYDGIGQGISALCMMLSRVAEVDASYTLPIFTSSLSQRIILEAGADEIAMRIFPNARTAREYIIAFPSFCNPGHIVSLPQAASSSQHYKLTGKLDYLVLGNFSNWAVIPARVTGKPGYSLFLANLNEGGIKKSDPIFSLGLHACPIVDITFDGANAQLIGEEGAGKDYFDTASRTMHVATASISAGVMKGSLKEAIAYANEREQGGRNIMNWSELRMILANMAVKSHAADMCVAQSCQAIEANIDNWAMYSMSASLVVHEMTCEAVNDGVQVLGGVGYMKDCGQEKRYRDARQVQALLGLAPVKKLALIKEVSAWVCGMS
jgi:alkylation response protein AidB-like acyl-CoA dehydrogenase